MRRLVLLAMLAACGRIGFDPLGSGGGVVEDDLVRHPIIAAGDGFSCVRRGDGSVWCWGDGREGALGNGGEAPRPTPARIENLPPVIAIDVGRNHGCGITDDGELWCWGDNVYGQIDPFAPDTLRTPTRIPLGRTVLAVGTGSYHTCALTSDDRVSCWGKNSSGQLGRGATDEKRMELDVLDQVTSLATGDEHTCVVRAGVVWCWGSNQSGQIGDGNVGVDALAPVELAGITATSVAAGSFVTCALDGGRYRCWGYNGDGELGIDGTFKVPAPLSSTGGYVALRVGVSHTCAIRDDETMWCWGDDRVGELGDGQADGASRNSSAPIQVPSPGPIADVAAGNEHTCATAPDGVVTCWGIGRFGQIGDASRMVRSRPQEVMLPGSPVAVRAGSRTTCAVVMPGFALYCWGENGWGQLALPEGGAKASPMATGQTSVDDFTLGEDHGCGFIAGTLECWGAGYSGQLGDGLMDTRYTPMPVALTADRVDAGYALTCATDSTNVWCWGASDYGKTGVGTGNQLSPVMVARPGSSMTAGNEHACLVDGTDAYCWGWNARGQLGLGTITTMEPPTLVTGGLAWAALAAGGEHTCGLTTASALYCWGINAYGVLGVSGNDSDVPTQVVATGAAQLAAGWYHTCAEIGGTARCWGHNVHGELGDGTLDDRSAPSTVVDVPAGVISVAAGYDHTCMLASDNAVRCWGDNTLGQLGIGILGFVPSPAPVGLP